MTPLVKVIIPACNEEQSVGKVLKQIPADLVEEIIVVNNASTDETEFEAKKGGAKVLNEPVPGYGRACLKGMDYIFSSEPKPDIIVFLDADNSDYPEEMPELIEPIAKDGQDLVIGSRTKGVRERGSMTIQQLFGNWLATRLLKLLYDADYTDLGPFRAIRYESLLKLDMVDKTYGWTVEMQLKAAKQKLKIVEVPVNYRKRIGISKISGTMTGTVKAGYKIIATILKYL